MLLIYNALTNTTVRKEQAPTLISINPNMKTRAMFFSSSVVVLKQKYLQLSFSLNLTIALRKFKPVILMHIKEIT
jgi:hypothetical protein